MTRRPDLVRRLTLATLLALAAGVSVGDDVVTAPDARRGSRSLVADLPHPLGATTVHVPRTQPAGVALLVHDRDVGPLDPLLDALAATTLLIPVDARTLAGLPSCEAFVDALAATSRRAQREAGLTAYHPPVVVGVGAASRAAQGAVTASPPGTFASGVGARVPRRRVAQAAPTDTPLPCTDVRASTDERWRLVRSSALVVETARALATPLPPPTTGHAPLDRWLTHFALPMTAAWAPRPRAVVILMSDARVLRQAPPDLAAALVARDVSVLTIDALRYLWQRHSPRDVAFELQRLLGALASLGVPVVVGGQGSGAETMAVAMRQVETPRPDALLLVNPGPSAFFEVDPPLPALVPLLRPDWSTTEAVATLGLPTLCVSTGDARARGVCAAIADERDNVTALTLGPGMQAETALPDRIVALIEEAGDGRPRQPRKPST